jgi:type I restriction enzyme, S subunit
MSNKSCEWPLVPIKSVYHALYDGPHATPKPADEGPVFLGIKNITEDGRLDLSEIRHISEEEFPRWTRRVEPRAGDIVFTYEATLNRYAIIPEGFRGCLGRRLALIRPDESKVDKRFLFYSFFSDEWRQTIANNTLIGSTVDRIPLTNFPEFPIRLPPLPTQRKIAGILSAYDDLIENNTRRIAILEEMAQRLYQEWFVHFRYPGHEDVPLVDSELGPIPEGWEVKRLGEVIAVNPRTVVPKEGLKPFVPMASLSENSMLIADITTREGNSGSKFMNGDTLLARITPCLENGKTGFVQFLPEPDAVAFGSTEFIVLRSVSVCPEFAYLLARSEEFRNQAIRSMTGATGRQRVQDEAIRNYLVVTPPQPIIGALIETTKPLFEQIWTLACGNSYLIAMRDLLLPRLLSTRCD